MRRLTALLGLCGLCLGLMPLPGPATPQSPPAAGALRLQLHAVGGPDQPVDHIVLAWSLRNTGATALRVASHVLAGPYPHFDTLTLKVCQTGLAPRCQDVRFQAPRAASMPVQATLAPGQVLRHEIDLTPWLTRQGIRLMPGSCLVQLVYEQGDPGGQAPGQRLWQGRLESELLALTLRPR